MLRRVVLATLKYPMQSDRRVFAVVNDLTNPETGIEELPHCWGPGDRLLEIKVDAQQITQQAVCKSRRRPTVGKSAVDCTGFYVSFIVQC
jgi:hypothetical protein